MASKKAIIIIFGCRQPDEYRARAEKAISWALDNNVNPIFIFTGVEFPPMLDKIVKIFGNGHTIWENISRTTKENIHYVFKRIKQNWFANQVMLKDYYAYVFVSSWYHVPRIKLILRKNGVNGINGIKGKCETFIKSYQNVHLINVLVEPFALLAAKFGRINEYTLFTKLKRIAGYNV